MFDVFIEMQTIFRNNHGVRGAQLGKDCTNKTLNHINVSIQCYKMLRR